MNQKRWAGFLRPQVCGYAVNIPETNYLPPEHWLVRRLSQRLYGLRLEQPQLELGPDGKVLILLREEKGTWGLAQ